jgi:HK97 family phage portal protein
VVVAEYSLGRAVPSGGRHAGGSLIPPPGVTSFGLSGPFVWDAASAVRIPAVSRAVQVYSGLTRQMKMLAYRGTQPLPVDQRPRILKRPDPTRGGPWFVGVSVEDYLLNGNAICYVTARGADGWPLSVLWLPASWVSVIWLPGTPAPVMYYLSAQVAGLFGPLVTDDVIHVMRGADRYYPVRGVGVIEEHLDTLDRVAMEEEYERSALAGGAVPSVAVITPNATLTQAEADEAKERFVAKFGGPVREPVIVPNGTQIVPLAWSPSDTQLTAARQLSLLDVANMFNLDGYWLGAPVAGMTYRTAGPQYQQILRTSLEPVLADFEDVWSDAWLPRGTEIRFDRQQLLKDDLPTTIAALMQATGGEAILSPVEARTYLGLPGVAGAVPAEVEIQGGA